MIFVLLEIFVMINIIDSILEHTVYCLYGDIM